jgi:hypothetical protein
MIIGPPNQSLKLILRLRPQTTRAALRTSFLKMGRISAAQEQKID